MKPARNSVRNAFSALFAVLFTVGFAPLAAAQSLSQAGFESYLQYVAAKARSEGVSQATISSTLSGLTINTRVIELDTAQPGRADTPPPLSPYLARHVDSARINAGKAKLQQIANLLPSLERRFGVPPQVVTAIWGHETNYGKYTGDFDLARSLATLAYEGRRRALFEGELIALMKMVDRGVPLSRMKGSWAGAFGYPQFLPSVYLTTAADGDGDGYADIWTSSADTLASVSNYFVKAGWRHGQPWGVGASLPPGFNPDNYASRLAPSSCARVHERHSAWKTVNEWRALGVQPLAPIDGNVMTALFQPDGPGTRAWLLTGNYRVILQYNCSNYYAMSVGLLADEIAR
ncbi:MAG: lytic murein transglycosylase [Novosphingobium sp.]|nr:lytic murein transglycosylase [Novosphingobium sp.]